MKCRVNWQALENYRKAHRLSKKEFCKRCRLSVSLYNKMMNGYIGFKLEYLIAIAEHLSTTVSCLLLEEDVKNDCENYISRKINNSIINLN